jgi:hypothetical protein
MLPALACLLLLAGCTDMPGGSAAIDATAPPRAAMEPTSMDQPATDVPPATAPAAARETARFDGYAGMRFGMTEAEARAAMDGGLADSPGDAPGDACHYLHPAGNGAQADPAFMFEGGRFVRYDVGNGSRAAPGGGRRGMSEDAIRALYPGRVQSQPHKYTDGRYLRVDAEAGDGALVFETDAGGTVTGWHVGVPPQVDYVEGCS